MHPVKNEFDKFDRSELKYNLRPWSLPIVGRTKDLIINNNIPIQKLENIKMKDLFISNKANIRYSLLKNKNKSNYSDLEFQADFQHLVNTEYNNFTKLYTDGSKINNKCGCAVFIDTTPPITIKKRLPTTSSVFNAEMYAIYQALIYVNNTATNHNSNFVIFSDSLSSLQFLDNSEPDHRTKINILKLLKLIKQNIIFEWVPAHTNIRGNDMADKAAKESLDNSRIVKLPMAYNEYKSIVKTMILKQWQEHWTQYGRCRLKSFKPILGDWKSAYRKNRREEKILSRLKTGSCLFLVQHYFDPNKSKEHCISCDMGMTIKHMLIECPTFQNSRTRIVNYLNYKKLVLSEDNILSDTFPHELLFIFLKEINYYKKI